MSTNAASAATSSPRAAIYARISSVRKTGDTEKVPAQVAACEELAAEHGYTVVATFRESDGTSALGSAERPQFDRLLDLIASGEVDVVLATESERLERNEADGMRLRVASAATGTRWHTVGGGVVDLGTASGSLIAVMKSAVGRYESTLKSERQRANYAKRRSAGLPCGGPRVFGWKVGRMEVEPVEADMIRGAVDHLLAGGSVYQVVKRWNASGRKSVGREMAWKRYKEEREVPVRPKRFNSDGSRVMEPAPEPDDGCGWTYAGVQQVLTRPRNAALVEQGSGNIVEGIDGQWDAILDRERWEAVCALLSRPERTITPDRAPRSLVAGIARCGVCGQVMRTTSANGRRYYRCASRLVPGADTRRHCSYPADDLDRAVGSAVASWFLYSTGEGDPHVATLRDLMERMTSTREQIGRLVEAVAEGALRAADVKAKRAALEAEEESLRREVAHVQSGNARAALLADARSQMWATNAAGRVDLVRSAGVKAAMRERFEALPLEQRRSLVVSLFEVTVRPGRTPDRLDIRPLRDVEPADADALVCHETQSTPDEQSA